MEGMGEGLWINFKRHVRFLKEVGFVDDSDRLTPEGEWASRLRLDYPLLIAEAIRKQAFNSITPEVLAGCIAPFVWDRVQELVLKIDDPLELQDMEEAFHSILKRIESIRELKLRRGFENPPIFYWPAVAIYMWAKGVPWEKLFFYVPVDEGDMASMVVRTADHLRQVVNLGETHPELTSTARAAIDLIIREPVFLS